MPVTVTEHSHDKLVHIRMSGKLDKGDYDLFLPLFDRLIEEKRKVDLLVEMHDFHGWDLAALWEDIKLETRHFNDIRRLAMVGERRWQEWMSMFCKPFITAEVRYFDAAQLAEAWQWMEEEI